MKKSLNHRLYWLFARYDDLVRSKHLKLMLLGLLVLGLSTKNVNAEKTALQDEKISGVVVDATTNEPLPGVTVLVEGTTIGTATDLDGKFSISLPDADNVLLFSFIGYAPQKVKPEAGVTQLEIKLALDVESLDEVVVVGYGTMKKKDLTGSIAQVRPDKMESENPNTVQDVLRGMPGLSVGFDSSAKGGGSMQIRGQNSLYTSGGHNSPLIILDDMPFYGELSEINPDDINQIDVLKDASASAVYGAKAANGVIIISTKRGKKGKPIIRFSSSMGIATMGANREVFTPDEYIEYYEDWFTTPTYGVNEETGNYEDYQGARRANTPGYFTNPTEANLAKYGITLEEWRGYTSNIPDGTTDQELFAGRLGIRDKTLQGYLEGNTFDWYDHSFRTGINQDYNISVSGADERVNYYMSAGYLSNEGVAVGNDYSTVRSNLKVDGKVTDWLTVGGNVNFQDRTDGDLAVDWQKQFIENSPFSSHTDENGDLIAHPMRDGGYAQGYNYDFDRQYRTLEKGYTVLNSIFTAKVTLPFNITYSFNYAPRYQFFYDRYHESAEHPDWAGINGLVNREQRKRFDWSLNNRINWSQTFADVHRVEVTLVQESEERRYWMDRIQARDIQPTDALGFHETENANKDKSSFDSHDTHETADGMLARLFYSFNDRYMFTGSVRRDGYSAFGTSNPRATFYSTAFAWTFTEENFFAWEPMNSGKLRISWGQNGNRSLGNPYLALARLGLAGGTQGYVNGNNEYIQYQALNINRLANTHLQWEKTTAFNVGTDLAFMDDRFVGSLDYYVMPTTDMIMNRRLPDFSGFSSITTNLGEVENRGFELAVTSRNITNENFKWTTSLGFTKYKNTIKHLYNTYEDVLDSEGNIISTKETDDISNNWFIDQPISSIWDYNVTGIWQKDEVEEAAIYGQKPGDPKVANNYTDDDVVNEDGTVTPVYNNEDKEFLGQTAPPVHWSLRNDFNLYKNFDVSINIYSYWGHKSMNGNYLNRDNNLSQVDNAYNGYAKEYWTIDNATDEYARLNATGPSGLEAPRKLYDRSFIRLENIALSYTVPSNIIQPLGFNNVKVFANVRNALVWAKDWEYWDPETGGLAPRTYTFGFNVTL